MTIEGRPGIGQPVPDYYRPYTDLDLTGYSIVLAYLNQQYLDEARSLLEYVPLTKDQCLILVGSDGKKERHAQSKTDVVIVQRPNSENLTPNGFMDWFDKTHSSTFVGTFDLVLDESPEVKVIGQDGILVSSVYPDKFKGGNRRIYPDRTLNALFVTGNEDVYKEARRQVLEEMTKDGKTAGHIRRELVKQVKTNREVMKTGLFRERATFTVDPPIQYYDEDEYKFTTGFKIGFLRTVQRFLDIATVVAIRQGFMSVDDAAVGLPTSTVERIRFLDEKGLFRASISCEGVINAYLWFLQQYHFAQEQYKRTRVPIELPFNSSEFQAYSVEIDEFTARYYLSPKRNFLAT